ncbi:MAG: polysaccharide deacetylase family protein [Candidatus Eisenbacteria sp.]|nr:polysaccharide deacetylase family protein [Candidatus Eisenbacteria bacterium]
MKNPVCVTGLLILAAVLATAALAADHAVILQYHHFGSDTPPSTSVTLEQFDRHLAYLEENGYSVWSLERIVSHLRERKDLPGRCVAITIDDAYVSVYEWAFPRLKARGWPFTVFVPTGAIGRESGVYMNWDQMREMQEFGASFAGHGHSHAYLIRREPGESGTEWKRRVTEDIRHSLDRLETELGLRSGLFAYPYGEYDRALREIVLGMGLVGFGQHSGPVWSGSDFGALPRFPMAGRYADMDEFVTKVRSLPLPVVSATPDDPLLPPGESRPLLRLELGPGDYRANSIACYVSGQGVVPIRWVDREKRVLEVSADEALPIGRSRYNITAPNADGTRYYWYSHLWIRPGDKATRERGQE